MALDTADKRDSAIHISLPWRMRFPAPDGTISAADRQHVSLLYRGIAAAQSAIATLVGQWSKVIECHGNQSRIEIHGNKNRIEVHG